MEKRNDVQSRAAWRWLQLSPPWKTCWLLLLALPPCQPWPDGQANALIPHPCLLKDFSAVSAAMSFVLRSKALRKARKG